MKNILHAIAGAALAIGLFFIIAAIGFAIVSGLGYDSVNAQEGTYLIVGALLTTGFFYDYKRSKSVLKIAGATTCVILMILMAGATVTRVSSSQSTEDKPISAKTVVERSNELYRYPSVFQDVDSLHPYGSKVASRVQTRCQVDGFLPVAIEDVKYIKSWINGEITEFYAWRVGFDEQIYYEYVYLIASYQEDATEITPVYKSDAPAINKQWVEDHCKMLNALFNFEMETQFREGIVNPTVYIAKNKKWVEM